MTGNFSFINGHICLLTPLRSTFRLLVKPPAQQRTNSSNMKFLHFLNFLGDNFGLPGSGSETWPAIVFVSTSGKGAAFSFGGPVDQLSIKTPNLKCRLVGIFDPSCELVPLMYLWSMLTGGGGVGLYGEYSIYRSYTLCIWPDSEHTKLLYQKSLNR